MLPMIKANYQARAVSSGFGTSSNENTQIFVQFEVLDESHAGETITWIGHFTDKTQDRTIESLQHMGWKGDDLTELEELDATRAATVLPDVVQIACDVDEYNGERKLKVQWVNKPGSGKFKFKEPLTGGGLKAFAQQMRGTIRSAQQGGAPTPKKAAAPAASRNGSGGQSRHPNAPSGIDDENPF